jgi:hypothetical protein
VDDADARVRVEPEGAEMGGDFLLMADQMQLGQLSVLRQRELCAVNDDATTVVATHDIHCDAHK